MSAEATTHLMRGKLEAEAIRLVREGASFRQAADRTGMTVDHLRGLIAEQPPMLPTRCTIDRCGQPQVGAGHPRKGWVQLKAAGEKSALWFHHWNCVVTYARGRAGAR